MQLRSMGGNDHLIRHLTMAATSNMCISPTTLNGTSCNVCGLVFHTMWTFFFPGNMFATSCEYVNRLLPPDQFEDRMQEFVGLLLLRRLRTQVTTNLLPERMDYFGLGRYAIDHWIGSHPSLLPCDLSNPQQDLAFWRQSYHYSSAFNLSTDFIPRGIPFDLWPANEVSVVHNASVVRREAAYFAGHLLRWYNLYQEAPQLLAWQWWSLPEGLTWLKGNIVDKLVSKYVEPDP
jgi:hypothetical protein